MRYLIQQNIVLFIASLIIYYYNPSLGLILISVSIGLFAWEFMQKRTRFSPVVAILSAVSVFLLLEDYSTKRQAKIIVAEVVDYYHQHHQTPKDLGELFVSATMLKTAVFGGFTYSQKLVSRHRCVWKLEFTNLWGTTYFYNDRVEKFEETQHLAAADEHWNKFWKVEPHLKAAAHKIPG